MKTESTEVTEVVQIWAIPQSVYHMEAYPDDLPFRYDMRTGQCYTDGAVKVHEETVHLWVPAGIDLTEKAVETLREEIKVVKQDTKDRLEELEKQINNLLLLEHQPTLEVV